MNVFIISTEDHSMLQMGKTHYIVAAENSDQACALVTNEGIGLINQESVRCVSHVLSTPVTEPMILETI